MRSTARLTTAPSRTSAAAFCARTFHEMPSDERRSARNALGIRKPNVSHGLHLPHCALILVGLVGGLCVRHRAHLLAALLGLIHPMPVNNGGFRPDLAPKP